MAWFGNLLGTLADGNTSGEAAESLLKKLQDKSSNADAKRIITQLKPLSETNPKVRSIRSRYISLGSGNGDSSNIRSDYGSQRRR
jgi:hypothetical protein